MAATACVGAVVAVLMLVGKSHGAEFHITADPGKRCSAIEVVGEVKPGDAGRLQSEIVDAERRAPLRRLYLNSRGGDFVSATAMWQTIRNLKGPVDVIVRSGNECSSACLLLLAAGEGRHVSAGANLVMHVARDSRTDKPSPLATLTFAYYLVESGFSREVISSLMRLKDGQEIVLSASSARRYGFDKLRYFGSTDPPATEGCGWKGFFPLK